jgi:putative SOS response-associated peptidase YedK
MRWGRPPPQKLGEPPATNICNTSSPPHWRGWLKPENRCLVPFSSFAEYAPKPGEQEKRRGLVSSQRRSPADGLCRHRDRVLQGLPRDQGRSRFPAPPRLRLLTAVPNAVVEPIHPKAMPVTLKTDEERGDRGMRQRRCSPAAG